MKSFVYFISDSNYIKIGKANRVSDRLIDLQGGNPNVLNVVTSIECASSAKAYKLEKTLHTKFYSRNIRGEWFDISEQEAITAANDIRNTSTVIDVINTLTEEELLTYTDVLSINAFSLLTLYINISVVDINNILLPSMFLNIPPSVVQLCREELVINKLLHVNTENVYIGAEAVASSKYK